MLTKDDKKDVAEIAATVFADFFHEMPVPYFEEKFRAIDRRFKAIDERFKAVDERFDRIDMKFDDNERYHQKTYETLAETTHTVRSHEKRISKLETSAIVS